MKYVTPFQSHPLLSHSIAYIDGSQGINVTAFTSGMLEQRRLDERLYEVLVQLMPAGKLSESPSDEALASAGLADVHEFYGK